MQRQRRPTAVYEIIPHRISKYLDLAKQMLNFLTPYVPEKSPFSYRNYLEGRQHILREVIATGMVRLGSPENRYEYILLTSGFQSLFEAGPHLNNIVITDPELAAAIRLEYWLRYTGPGPRIVEPFREMNLT